MLNNVLSKNQNVNTSGLEIIVSAPGKVILHGEHSVVYGKLALAASLGLRTKIILSEINEANTFKIVSQVLNHQFDLQEIKSVLSEPLPLLVDQKDYSWEYPNLLNHEKLVQKIDSFLNGSNVTLSNINEVMSAKAILYLCAGIIGSTSTDLKSIELRITTDLTTGAGMGSSASFSVCVAAALVQYVKSQRSVNSFSKKNFKPSHWNIDLDHFNPKELDLICQWSYCAEKIIHGTPSGLDNTTCTYGSIVEFRKGTPPIPLNTSCSLNLLLINSRVPRETKKLVAIAASYNKKFPDIFNSILDAMEATSVNALKNYKDLSQTKGDEDTTEIYSNLNLLYSMNHALLNSMGVGHSKLEEIVGILSESGLIGKLTGAGGGGYAICLIPQNFNNDRLEKVIRELDSKGFEVVRTDLGGDGLRLESFLFRN